MRRAVVAFAFLFAAGMPPGVASAQCDVTALFGRAAADLYHAEAIRVANELDYKRKERFLVRAGFSIQALDDQLFTTCPGATGDGDRRFPPAEEVLIAWSGALHVADEPYLSQHPPTCAPYWGSRSRELIAAAWLGLARALALSGTGGAAEVKPTLADSSVTFRHVKGMLAKNARDSGVDLPPIGSVSAIRQMLEIEQNRELDVLRSLPSICSAGPN